MTNDPTMSDPSQDMGDSGMDEGTTVCITASPDGTFTVQIQEAASSDESGEDESGDGPQTADNLDDALALAGHMLTAEMGEDSGDGDAPMDPATARSAWNQMAAKRSAVKAQG